MRRFRSMFVLLLFIILCLAGCNKKTEEQTTANLTVTQEKSDNREFTKDQIRNFTMMADSMISKIFGSNNIDKKYTIKKDGQSGLEYGKSINFKSKDIIKQNLINYFDANGIDAFMDNMIIEKNGELYILIGQAGLRPDLKTSEMKLTRKENEINIEFTSGSGDNTVTEDKTLIYKDDKWIFKDLWYTN